ncbi:MAG: RDD family protein [Candidatus Sedimenticola sp. PURPLELP]
MDNDPPPSEHLAMEAVIEYAGFWHRAGATLIDSIIIGIITAPMLYSVYGADYFTSTETLIAGSADFVVSYLLPAVAIVLFWRYWGATPGKMLIHVKIVDARTYNPPSAGQLVGRYLGYLASAIPLMLGFIWIAFDRKKQGFHDKLSGTVVIRSYD